MLALKKITNYKNKIAFNYASNLYANSRLINNPIYIPTSGRQTPTKTGSPIYYLFELTNEATGEKFDTVLELEKSSSNARYIESYIYFGTATRNGVIDIKQGGKYIYNIYGVLENTDYPADTMSEVNKNAHIKIETGVAMIYDDYEFKAKYYDVNSEVIPAVTVYKNE